MAQNLDDLLGLDFNQQQQHNSFYNSPLPNNSTTVANNANLNSSFADFNAFPLNNNFQQSSNNWVSVDLTTQKPITNNPPPPTLNADETSSVSSSSLQSSTRTQNRKNSLRYYSKSQKIASIQTLFTESQKLAYCGLCYLGIVQYKKERLVPLKIKRVVENYDKWAKAFFTKLFVYLELSEDEQEMIHQLSEHGILPSDFSASLILEAKSAAEKLQELSDTKQSLLQEAMDSNQPPPPESDEEQALDIPSDIRYTLLTHLFIMCISDGIFDSRSRTLLRQVSQQLEVPWVEVLMLEQAIADQLRLANTSGELKQDGEIIGNRNKIEGKNRWLYMGLATLAGGAVIGLTAGLAAPFIGAGIGAALSTVGISAGAAVTGTLTSTAGIAIITSTGVLTGGGMGGVKMLKRTRGITEFEFLSLAEGLKRIEENRERFRLEREKRRKRKTVRDDAKKQESKSDSKKDANQSPNVTTPSSKTTNIETSAKSLPSSTFALSGVPVSPPVVQSTQGDVLFAADDSEDFKDFQAFSQPNSTNDISAISKFPDLDEFGDFQEHGGGIKISAAGENDDTMTHLDFDGEGIAHAFPVPKKPTESTPEVNLDQHPSELTIENKSKATNVIITAAGWITYSNDDFTLPFSTLKPGLHGDQYTLIWESKSLKALGSTLAIIVSEMASFLIQQGIQTFALPMLMAALTGPLWALKLSYLIDNPWGIGLSKAKKAGKVLADTLINQVQENRPVTLIGYSLGARVVYFCLEELANRGAYGIVEEAYLFGCPIIARHSEWCAISSIVSGRIVNGYMRNDYVLGVLYRASAALWNEVAGLRPVENVPGVENVNLEGIIKGHLEYRAGMPQILQKCGFEVTQDYFDDEDEIAERERLEEEAERKKETEERLKKKREDLERVRLENARKRVLAQKNANATSPASSTTVSVGLGMGLERSVSASGNQFKPRKASLVNMETHPGTESKLWMDLLNETNDVEEAKKIMEMLSQPKEIKSTLPTLVLSAETIKTEADKPKPIPQLGAGDLADRVDHNVPPSPTSETSKTLTDVLPNPIHVATAAVAAKTLKSDEVVASSTGFADYFSEKEGWAFGAAESNNSGSGLFDDAWGKIMDSGNKSNSVPGFEKNLDTFGFGGNTGNGGWADFGNTTDQIKPVANTTTFKANEFDDWADFQGAQETNSTKVEEDWGDFHDPSVNVVDTKEKSNSGRNEDLSFDVDIWK